jgi:ABC-2 type transport system permease protein
MAVLDQSYRRWAGKPTSHLRRALVIPRYDLVEIVSRRAWLGAWVVSLFPPLLLALWAWLAANADNLRRLVPNLPAEFTFPSPGANSYAFFTGLQGWLMIVFAFLAGPPLATRDFANGAIPLFLSKSLRRFEYLAGRWTILLLLLSLSSFVPLLLVAASQAAMMPAGWFAENGWIFRAIVLGTLPLVLLLTMLVSALAAHVHRANLVRVALLAILLGTVPVASLLSAATGSASFRVISPLAAVARVRQEAFVTPAERQAQSLERATDDQLRERGGRVTGRTPGATELSLGAALATVFGWLAACVLVLWWRVRPVEVVR